MGSFYTISYLIIFITFLLCTKVNKADEDLEDEIPINLDDFDVNMGHNSDFDREVVLGSEEEAEEFKKLEPEEAKRRLGIIFDMIDTNKNRSICPTELSNWISQSLRKLDAENSVHSFNETDENHDGNVTFNEYLIKSYGHTEKEMGEIIKSPKEWKAFVIRLNVEKERFSLADKNNNSLLDFNEFIKFNIHDNYNEMSPYTLNRTIFLFDKNGDDLIDQEEFVGEDNSDNETVKYETALFKEHDRDNNGVLNATEILEWKTPGFEKTALVEMEFLFNKTDVNKDRKLSKEEVIDHHELWVGSHATDYGRHLDQLKPHEEL